MIRSCSRLSVLGPLLCASLWVGSGGCRSAGPPPAPGTPATPIAHALPGTVAAGTTTPGSTAPAALAEPALAQRTPPVVAEVLVAPLPRLAADVNVLGKELPVRLGDMLLEHLLKIAGDKGLPIDTDLVGALATDRPLAVVVTHRGAALPAGICLAAPLARPADAARAAARLGTPLSQRAGAVERKTPSGGTIWTGVTAGTLLMARSYDELWSIGARALEAARAAVPAEEIVATIYPQAIVTSTGSSWAKMAETFRKELHPDAGSIPGPRGSASSRNRTTARGGRATADPMAAPAMQASVGALGDSMARALSQTERVRLAIAASATDGLVASAALVPTTGTPLAASAVSAPGFTLDARLPVRDDRTGVTAWGSLGLIASLLRALLPPRPARAGGVAAAPLAPVDQFLTAFSGAGSCTFELGESPPSSVCALPLRPGTDARVALEQYTALVVAVLAWEASANGLPVPAAPKIRKGVLEFERPLAASAMSADQYDTIRSFMGGDTLKYAAGVRGDRLLQFQGGAPRARLDRWTEPASPAAGAPQPAVLEHTLARTRGYSAVALFDPMAFIFKFFEHAADPRSRQAAMMLGALPGLAATRTPVIVAAPGGPNVAYELHVPVVTFDNIAKLIRPFMNMGMGPGGVGGAP